MSHTVRVTGTSHRSSLTNGRPKYTKYFTVNIATNDVDLFEETKQYLLDNGLIGKYDIIKILQVKDLT